MMSRKKIASVFILLLISSFALFAQSPQQYFEQGNDAYSKQDFQGAVDNYNKVLDADVHSAEVYFNLANAYYKLNRIAPSIYNYEKALELDPGNADIKNNLAFAENMKIDAISTLPQGVFKRWYNALLKTFSLDGWAILTVSLILLAMVSFILYYFTYATGRKRLFFTSSFIALGLGIFALFMAFNFQARSQKDQFAIVFSKEAQVKSGPNLASEEAFILHEGTKVGVIEADGDWKRIKLADGSEGWIPASDIREL